MQAARLTQIALDRKLLVNFILLGGLASAISLVVYAFGSNSEKITLLNALFMLVAVLGLTVYSGNGGVLSFGHVAFIALGAQLSATLTIAPALKASAMPLLPDLVANTHLGLAAAAAVTVLAVGAVAALVGLSIARLDGASGSIATLGLLIIVNSLLIGAQGITRGGQAMYGIPPLVDIPVALAFTLACLFIARLYRDSKPGLALRCSREDGAAAAAIGIDVVRQRYFAFVLSAMLSALAGVMLAHFLTVFSPKTFYLHLTVSLIVMYIVGGAGSVTGAVVGVAGVTVVIELLRRLEPGFTVLAVQVPQTFGLTVVGLGALVLCVLYFRQQGLVGYAEVEDLLPLRRVMPACEHQHGTALPSSNHGLALVAEEVSKAYGGLLALDRVSLTLGSGEILGLIGPNGSGKSTLLGCLAGTHAPSGGTVWIGEVDVTSMPSFLIARQGIGRTFQTVRLFGKLTVLENVKAALAERFAQFSHRQLEAQAMNLLQRLEIEAMAGRRADELAYGIQRRLEIARALATNPSFLLLDEPAAGMNETETKSLLATLRSVVADRQIGLLIVDHDMQLIMGLCDRIVVLNKGQVIAQGTPSETRDNDAVREAYLGKRKAARQTKPPEGSKP